MNTTSTFSKDNAAATIMLSALFTLIAVAALNVTPATAKEVSAKTTLQATPQIETIVVTATRLK